MSAKFNQAFVLMEYFGYLRRDPDQSGYQFWLNKLNQFGGNFEQADMVKAFIVSNEYRQRFGPQQSVTAFTRFIDAKPFELNIDSGVAFGRLLNQDARAGMFGRRGNSSKPADRSPSLR